MPNNTVPAADTGLPKAIPVPADHPDKKIFRLIGEFDTVESAYDQRRASGAFKTMTPDEFEDAKDKFFHQYEDLMEQISETRAQTLQGLKAKAAFHEMFTERYDFDVRCDTPKLTISLWEDIRAL